MRLSERIREVFEASTTTDRNRKELLRMLVDRVVVERSNERIRARIVWKDGGTPTECEIKLTPLAQRRMLELDGGGGSADEIAEVLNREGYRTRQDSLFSADTVRHNLRTLKE